MENETRQPVEERVPASGETEKTPQKKEKFFNKWIVLVVFVFICTVAAFPLGLITWDKEDEGGEIIDENGEINYAAYERGWQTIHIATQPGMEENDTFVLKYNLGMTSDYSVAEEAKAVTELYSQLFYNAFRMFSPDKEYNGVASLYTLSSHPNRAITVNPTLYDALRLCDEQGMRNIFLAPLMPDYERMFEKQEDRYADPEFLQFCSEIAAFASDPNAIRLDLLDNSRVCLAVSDDYLNYIKSHKIERLVDFSWMKNAFIADFIAQRMTESGYTRGVAISVDGFTRSFETEGTRFGLNLQKPDVGPVVTMVLDHPISSVSLRDFVLYEGDPFYQTESGETRSRYLSAKTGKCLTSTDSIVAYSYEHSCAEVLAKIYPLFVTESFDKADVLSLETKHISTFYAEGTTVYYTEESAVFDKLYQTEDVQYEKELVQ